RQGGIKIVAVGRVDEALLKESAILDPDFIPEDAWARIRGALSAVATEDASSSHKGALVPSPAGLYQLHTALGLNAVHSWRGIDSTERNGLGLGNRRFGVLPRDSIEKQLAASRPAELVVDQHRR